MRREMRDGALDAMLEERDNLKIQINLMEDTEAVPSAPGSLSATRKQLAALEQRIMKHRKTAQP